MGAETSYDYESFHLILGLLKGKKAKCCFIHSFKWMKHKSF